MVVGSGSDGSGSGSIESDDSLERNVGRALLGVHGCPDQSTMAACDAQK